MTTHIQAGAEISRRGGDELTRLPFLRTWFRTRNAIVLHLSNGTLQVDNAFSVSYQRQFYGGVDGGGVAAFCGR